MTYSNIATVSTVVSMSLTALFATTTSYAQSALTQIGTQTDRSISSDYQGYQAQQAAIQALNDSGVATVKSYGLAKAQCWLDVSFHEYSRNDRSNFPQQALNESVRITNALKAGAAGANLDIQDTPLLNNAPKIREDLWAKLSLLKKDVGYACAQAQTACAEVELAHASNEYAQQGWRHAKPYIQMAEDYAAGARAAADACPVPPKPRPVEIVEKVAPAAVAAPVPAPAPIVINKTITIEKLSLSVSALFKFDKNAQTDLLDSGKAQLDDLAKRALGVYSAIESISLIGYTDRLGSDVYNAQLSQGRADTVKAYLESKGLMTKYTTANKGAADPIVECVGKVKTAKLVDCLQPNRRVEILITGVKK